MAWPFRTKDRSPAVHRKSAAAYLLGMGAARFMSRRYGVLADEGYARNPIVNACVNRIAQAAASVELQVYTRDESGDVIRLENHPLLALLNRPNPIQSGKKFVRDWSSQYLIGGNAYLLGTGINPDRGKSPPPAELYLLQPDKVTVIASKTTVPLAYEYKPTDTTTRFPVNQVTGRSAVLHVKTFNPLDPWYGLAPMVAAANGVDIFNAGQTWNMALLNNDARPSGALQVKGKDGQADTLTDEQYLRIKQQMDEQYSGSVNAGRPILLEGGLEWVQMSLNAKDMDHRENMLTNARFIAGVYNVPPMLVNIPGESTYSNMREAMQFFWTDTVLPLLHAFLDDLNGWLAPLYGDGVYVWYDEDMIPALEAKRAEKSKRINDSNFLTIDEKRAAMGYDDYEPTDKPGGVLLVQSSDVPLDLAGSVPLAEPGSEADPDAPA